MASADCCIACHRPFAPNHEIASIPDASRIAFDPARRRIWRICSICEEWNLLGPEAATAALPEIEARFAALAAGAEPYGEFAPARAGTVELLRIGAPGEGDNAFALRLDDELRHRSKMLRRAMVVIVVGLAVLAVTEYFIPGRDPWHWIETIASFSVMAPIFLAVRYLRRKKVTLISWIVALTFAAVGMAAIWFKSGWEHVRYDVIGMLLAAPLIFLTAWLSHRYLLVLRVRAASGRRIGISEKAVHELTIDWTDDGELVIGGLPNGEAIPATGVARFFHRVWPFAKPPSTRQALSAATQTRAADLLRAVGGMRGLRHALDGYRRDRDGRIPIVDLPWIYLLAIDFALTIDSKRDDSAAEALRARSAEASRIADEAEWLLRDDGDRAIAPKHEVVE